MRDALRSTILLYVDKFGEERLHEAAICLERIISSWRWEAERVRIEGVLSHVNRKDVVPVLLDATNAHHAIAGLLGICQTCKSPMREELSWAQESYFDRLCDFYCHVCVLPGIAPPVMHIIATIYKTGKDHE